LNVQDHRQFVHGRKVWLNVNPKDVYGAGDLPWDRPKILCNAVRSSRGPWRISAAVDRDGLVASQQFAVLWPKTEHTDLDALAAIINGPLGNAFLRDHSADRRLRIAKFLRLPLPRSLPADVGNLARQYAKLAMQPALFGGNDQAQRLLDQMDAMVLDAYDLSPRLVRTLLASFGDAERPLTHPWEPWNVTEADPALTLSEFRSGWVRKSQRNWVQAELEPIEGVEREVLAEIWSDGH
jgi:hypothetical protein